VHWIGPDVFHSVLAPADDTITLIIRCGINPVHPLAHTYDFKNALEVRTRVLGRLDTHGASDSPTKLHSTLCRWK
jgi:hypothetical protein